MKQIAVSEYQTESVASPRYHRKRGELENEDSGEEFTCDDESIPCEHKVFTPRKSSRLRSSDR